MRRSLILLTPSDKKKNESTQYTLDEMKSEIDSLSSPQGKTIIFRNLDESGNQSFVVQRVYKTDSGYRFTENSDVQEDPQQYLYFFLSSNHVNYIPGTIDTPSPIKFSDIEDGLVITAQPGYLYTTEERQLVDMTEYYMNNSNVTIYDKTTDNYRFSDTAIEYFKSVKPTSLQNAFGAITLDDGSGFWFLDTSECTNFNTTFENMSSSSDKDFYINLSMLDVSNGEDFSSCFSFIGQIDEDYGAILDISNWKFKENAILNEMFYRALLSHLIMNNVDVSKISNFDRIFYNLTDGRRVIEILDLKDWYNNIVISMNSFCAYVDTKIINIPNINTSNVTNFNYAFEGNFILQEIRGTIDMASATSYRDMFSNSVSNLTSPIKIKNPPSDTNWWQTAGFTSEDQFEIVT